MIVGMLGIDHGDVGIGIGSRCGGEFPGVRRHDNGLSFTLFFFNLLVAGLAVIVVVAVLDARPGRAVLTAVYAYFAG